MAEDVKIIEEMQKLFELQKQTNDELLKKQSTDSQTAVSELKAQLAKQDEMFVEYQKQMDAEVAKLKRTELSSGGSKADEDEAVQKAFFTSLQKGNASEVSEQVQSLLCKEQVKQSKIYGATKTEMETKNVMLSGIDTYGGLFVPVMTERSILKLLQDEVALYRLAEKKSTGTSSYERPIKLTDAGYRWVGETEQRSKTAPPTYGNVKIDIHTIMAEPELSSDLLEDASVNMEAELMDGIRIAFSEGLADAFVNGSGMKQPHGLLSYGVAEQNGKAEVAWGKLAFTKTGKAGDFDDIATGRGADVLIDAQTILKSGYHRGAVWLMNTFSQAKVRKLKDKDGNYLWQPSMQVGTPNTLLGYPVEIDEKMSNFDADAFPIAFGNFNRGYLVVERRGMRVIRDFQSKTPLIIFKTDLRIGGGVQNFHAIKLIKASA